LNNSTNSTCTILETWGSALVKFVSLLMVIMIVVNFTTYHLDNLKANNALHKPEHVSAKERTQQLECLTRNIYWEAAGEPFEGKVAVAQVTMNRVDSGKFASNVCGVVYQKNIVYEKVICQFSWYCEGTHKTKSVHGAMWKESEEVAKKVLLEGFRLPSLQKAMYFHATHIKPQWGKPVVAQIGNHIFYGEKI